MVGIALIRRRASEVDAFFLLLILPPAADQTPLRSIGDRKIAGPTEFLLLFQKAYASCVQIIDCADEVDGSIFYSSIQNGAALADLLHGVADVRFGDLVDQIPVFRTKGALDLPHFRHGRFDFFQQAGQVPEFHAVDGSFDAPAMGVSEDHDDVRASHFGGVFETAKNILVNDVPRQTGAENVSEALIENQFDRDTRINATDHGSRWILTNRSAPDLIHPVPLMHATFRKARVALLQKANGLGRRRFGLNFFCGRRSSGRAAVWRPGDRGASGRAQGESR